MTATITNSKLRCQSGLLMLLVVLGHMNYVNILECSPYYRGLREGIYMFHMPLFFVISGSTLRLVEQKGVNLKSFVSSRRRKFAIPFLIFSLAFSLYDFLFSNMSFDFSILTNILLYPGRNSAGYLWYILTLYLLYVLYAFCADRINRLIVFAPFTSIVSYYFGGDNLFFYVSFYFMFFHIGWVLYNRPIKVGTLPIIISGLFFIGLISQMNRMWLFKFFTGMAGIIPFITLPWEKLEFLRVIGVHSWSIYLWNVPILFFVNNILKDSLCNWSIIPLNVIICITLIIATKLLYEAAYTKIRHR